MDILLSYFILPGLTLLLPGKTNWFTSNFSVAGAYFPQNVLLVLWAIVIARFYHRFLKRTIGQTTSYLKIETELVLTDVSAYLLVGSVFFPYRPQAYPLFSFIHLATAFAATILFYTSITLMAVRLYPLAPDLFSLPVALLTLAIACTVILLIFGNFMISSALEIFLTIFSCVWLQLFDQRIRILSRRKSLKKRL